MDICQALRPYPGPTETTKLASSVSCHGQAVHALEVYALAKAWNLAQILPLPKTMAAQLQRMAGDFL